MKLKEFTVREFRSIWDSRPIEVDDLVTCLVGKNESGKTALLTALYRTNPIIPEDDGFDLTYDYPKREVEDYRFAIENRERQEAVVVDCLYELDAEDKVAVIEIFGVDVLKTNTFRQQTYYGNQNSTFMLTVNDDAARQHLASNPEFPDGLQPSLSSADELGNLREAARGSRTERRHQCMQGIGHKSRQEWPCVLHLQFTVVASRAQIFIFRRILPDDRKRQSRCTDRTRRQ